ncbi:MAG: FtsX-like permease family protein [Candidatus Thiodiazotropha sp.]|jgi:ABC-type lipoprotein release transport system permease subunit
MIALFRRQQYLLSYTLAAMLRRKGRNLALLFVYMLIIFVLASVMFLSHALIREAGIITAQSPEIIVQRMTAGRQALIPADYLERMGRLQGVNRREARLWANFHDAATHKNYTMRVDSHRELGDGEIIIGASMAKRLKVNPDDQLTLTSTHGEPYTFHVKGITTSPSELANAGLVLISAATFRRIFAVPPGYFSDIALSVPNPREVRTITEKLLKRLPDTRPILREEIQRTYDSIFAWRQGITFVLLVGAIFAFVIFAWDKANGLSSEERREIGILKAVGWETGDVLRMKFLEGLIISLCAFIAGCLGAYLHIFYASASLFEPILKGWSIFYPHFQIRPFIDGLQLATLFFFTVFPYTITTIIPIWRSAITDPDAVMR